MNAEPSCSCKYYLLDDTLNDQVIKFGIEDEYDVDLSAIGGLKFGGRRAIEALREGRRDN